MYKTLLALSALAAGASAQGVCTLTAETHPSMSWSTCTAPGSCTTTAGKITVDANWRWLHATASSTNCYTGNEWNTTLCTSGAACAAACCLDGADYAGTYGATASGDSLSLKFVTTGTYSTNIGSRMYLMASDTSYQMFKLLNQEFTFDVDVSNLPCGLNGAVYLVSMDADGGMAKYPTNKAGAKYGTGYCDSQCPRDLKFIDGTANVEGWKPSSNDKNAGVGGMGSCCSEMDLWEANSISTAYTPHPCTTIGQESCAGDACGGTYSANRYAGECDPDGCDFNSYRMGDTAFYGPGMTIDTKAKFTVVTQFLGDGGSLSEIRRFYVQNGKTYANSDSAVSGVAGNSLTTDFCKAQKTAFGDKDVFSQMGGLAQMGKALDEGMVLVMSLWDDHYSNMLWLDSTYPVDGGAKPGVARGTCATSSGVPADVESNAASASVVYSNIKVGPINSTFDATSAVAPSGGSSGGGNGTVPPAASGGASGASGAASAPAAQPTGADGGGAAASAPAAQPTGGGAAGGGAGGAGGAGGGGGGGAESSPAAQPAGATGGGGAGGASPSAAGGGMASTAGGASSPMGTAVRRHARRSHALRS